MFYKKLNELYDEKNLLKSRAKIFFPICLFTGAIFFITLFLSLFTKSLIFLPFVVLIINIAFFMTYFSLKSNSKKAEGKMIEMIRSRLSNTIYCSGLLGKTDHINVSFLRCVREKCYKFQITGNSKLTESDIRRLVSPIVRQIHEHNYHRYIIDTYIELHL